MERSHGLSPAFLLECRCAPHNTNSAYYCIYILENTKKVLVVKNKNNIYSVLNFII